MHVLVAVKQVPRSESLALGSSGRLERTGVPLEMSAYCRRALAKGIELAQVSAGRCTVVSLGPPSATAILRDALACGADEAILLSDPAFAGSDTLVTARALAALVATLAPVDLVLVGRASLDAETGQVGPQLAELLDLPFAGAVRSLDLDASSHRVEVRCEHDDGGAQLVVALPAVLALAERSCSPAKADPMIAASIPPERVLRRSANDLPSNGPWGEEGSPTRVEALVPVASDRAHLVHRGPLTEQVDAALRLLGEPTARPLASRRSEAALREHRNPDADAPAVAVVLETGRPRLASELLGAAARLAGELDGPVTALTCEHETASGLWSLGADAAVELHGSAIEEDIARTIAHWASRTAPTILLFPATSFGREVSARVATRLDAGLIADALDLEIVAGRLCCAKAACAGGVTASITSRSPIQIATVRPGVLACPPPRPGSRAIPLTRLDVASRHRVEVRERWRDDDVELLERAETVIGIGLGVSPEEYADVRELAAALGAELGATRKVTDRFWLPRARQIGITGRNIAPRLYVALGISGSLNHLAGVRRAGTILAVNTDPDAPIFNHCDIGIVGDWREVARRLREQLGESETAVELAPLA